MWHFTYHRFPSRAAFLTACTDAGWQPVQGAPSLPQGVTLDEIGPHVAAATLGPDGAPIAGEVLDARWHVNAGWHGVDMPAAFQAALTVPATPTRGYDMPAEREPPPAPAPISIASWKAKAWLLQAGLLAAATQAAEDAGGIAKLAFDNAAEWNRSSTLMYALAQSLNLTDAEIDAAFQQADAIQG